MEIAEVFKNLKRGHRAAIIPFVTAGFPTENKSRQAILKLAKLGADIIEVGLPYSDPLADGPTIQSASASALKTGMNTVRFFRLLKDAGLKITVPLVILTYYNPVLQYGLKRFAAEAARCGAKGVIIPDLPLEESELWVGICRSTGIAPVMLASPTTPISRIKKLSKAGAGFLYYVTLTGVTGARKELPGGLIARLKDVRRNSSLPVACGFGISRPDQVKKLKSHTDGVIIGSALLKKIASKSDWSEWFSKIAGICHGKQR